MKQNKQMNIKDKLAHCLVEADFGGMNITILDYGAVEELLEKTISQTRQEAVEEIKKSLSDEMALFIKKISYEKYGKKYIGSKNGFLRQEGVVIDLEHRLQKALSQEKK